MNRTTPVRVTKPAPTIPLLLIRLLVLLCCLTATACDSSRLNPIGLDRTNNSGGTSGSDAGDLVEAGSGTGGASGAGNGGSDAGAGGHVATGGVSGAGGNGVNTGGNGANTGGAVSSGGTDGGADSGVVIRPKVTQIVAGERHTCALLSDGTVKCWGANVYGQLGYGKPDTIGDDETPAAVGTVSVTSTPGVTVTSLAAGWQHTCALLSDHSVKCWGWNDRGQLGYGNTDEIGDDELPSSVGPVSVTTTPGVNVTAIVSGRHTCALLSDGTVKCWGGGPLGYGNTDDVGDDELPSSVAPINVTSTPGVTVTSLAATFYDTCALLSDHSVKCWGSSGWGELGLGNTMSIGDDESPSSVGPISVTSIPGVTVTAIAGGFNHLCALLSNGSVKCWGSGVNGTGGVGYGNGTIIGDDELPSSVGAISLTATPGVTATAIACGTYHTCALLSDSSVTCWGWNAHGQLGSGNTNLVGDDEVPSSLPPASITRAGAAQVVGLGAGASAYDTCAILADGSAKCWGFNDDGELGYGSVQDVGHNELPSTLGAIELF
jgi:alpha-tubulin suppressor-like RCC1 family protein